MELRLNELLLLALKYNATDLHFRLRDTLLDIEMRIDGQLKKVKTKINDYRLIRYLKYLANLDVSNLYEPQTEQFELEVNNSLLHLRFAVIDSSKETTAVLRILDNKISKIDYNSGALKEFSDKFNETVNKGCGLFLISGPTGSGKTTLAYNILNTIKNHKVFTVEDPIEVYNDNLVQIQINNEVGLNYEEAIKQVLRHNPDVIFIGEIRDSATAKATVMAATTGHVVIATIHASSCSNTIDKMVEYGVNKDNLTEQLKAVINLRLNITEDGKKLLTGEYLKGEN